MTDIVEQLRNHHKDIGLPDNVESWLTSAADEIERLRSIVNQFRQFALNGEMDTIVSDEIERLRSENQELKLQYLSDQGQWIEETGRLRAEFAEMREDLVYLNKMCMTLMSLLPPETTPEDVRAAMAKQGSHVREEKRIITDV